MCDVLDVTVLAWQHSVKTNYTKISWIAVISPTPLNVLYIDVVTWHVIAVTQYMRIWRPPIKNTGSYDKIFL